MATCTATARNCSATLREHRDGGGAAAREPAGEAAEGTDGDRILLFFAMAYSGGCVIHNTHTKEFDETNHLPDYCLPVLPILQKLRELCEAKELKKA
jgi:hypothetical protein